MSTLPPSAAGAAAPSREDTSLFNLVAALLKVPRDEREVLHSYTQEECDAETHNMVGYVEDPESFPQKISIQEVIGRLFLLHYRKTEMQIASFSTEVETLRSESADLEIENRALHKELKDTNALLTECTLRLRSIEKSTQDAMGESVRRESQEARAKAREALGYTPFDKRETEYLEACPTEGYPTPTPAASTPKPWLRVLDSEKKPTRDRDVSPSPYDARPKYRSSSPLGHSKYHPSRRPSSPQRGSSRTPRLDSWRERRYSSSDESDGSWREHDGLRMRQLDSFAKDVERFDPANKESNVTDYLREIEHCLADLPRASSREKLKLIWKTTSRSVHDFIETQPSRIRDNYRRLCEVLCEEYSPYTDETSATLSAIRIQQKRTEPPREYYRRLRNAYFQGSSEPGLEEDRGFRSLFLHNLHPCVRTHVTLTCKQNRLTMQEIRKMAQMTWETIVRPSDKHDDDARVLGIQSSESAELELEGSEVPPSGASRETAPPKSLLHHQQGGGKNPKKEPQAHYQKQNRPAGRNFFQKEKSVQFDKNPKRWNKDKSGGPDHSKKSDLTSELSLIRKCLADVTKHFDSHRPPSGHKGADEEPPSA